MLSLHSSRASVKEALNDNLTHLPSPFDSLPDAEVAEDPDHQQGEGQLPAYTARVINAVGDLQGAFSVARRHSLTPAAPLLIGIVRIHVYTCVDKNV